LRSGLHTDEIELKWDDIRGLAAIVSLRPMLAR
jgi:hypothetical protein